MCDALSLVRKAERAARTDVVGLEDRAFRMLVTQHREVLRSAPTADTLAGLPLPSSLYPHQRDGVAFLLRAHLCGSGGCVLADDMGLGKTVQIATFLHIACRRHAVVKILIVAPTSVLDAWSSTLRGEFGGFEQKAVMLYTGAPDRRRKLFDAYRAASQPTVLLTTIGVLGSDIDVLEKYRFDYAVVDEAHVIRNPATAAHKNTCRLVAKHRIAVTGTPVMNSVLDLWSIMQFVDPDALGLTRSQCAHLSDAVNRGNERDCLQAERAQAMEMLQEATQRVGHMILRRTKADADRCLALTRQGSTPSPVQPALTTPVRRSQRVVQATKHEIVLWLTPSPEQLELYTAYLSTEEVANALAGTKQSSSLVLLVNLKKICDHPWLNLTKPNLADVMRHPFETPLGDLSVFGNAMSSAKVTTTVSLCRSHAEAGLKTVVFATSKVLLDIVAMILRASGRGLTCVFLTGDVHVAERQGVIDRFNRDPQVAVCCVTTGVGGVGVTLTGASRAVIMDPSWNPAVDAQAVDRVHRIGQSTDVIVFRLITAGTVEEKIYRRQIAKTLVAKQATARRDALDVTPGTQASAAHSMRYFTRGQLRDLFSFDPSMVTHSETAALVQRLHGTTLHPDLYRYAATGCVVDASDHLSLFGAVVVDAAALEDFLNAEGEGKAAKRGANVARGGRRRDAADSPRGHHQEGDAFEGWLHDGMKMTSPPQVPRAAAQQKVRVAPPAAVVLMKEDMEEVFRPSVQPRKSCYVARKSVALFQTATDDFEQDAVADAQRAFGADVIADDDATDEREGVDIVDDDDDFDESDWRQGGDTGEARVWPAPRDTLSNAAPSGRASSAARLSVVVPEGASRHVAPPPLFFDDRYSVPLSSGRPSAQCAPLSPVRGSASLRPSQQQRRDSAGLLLDRRPLEQLRPSQVARGAKMTRHTMGDDDEY